MIQPAFFQPITSFIPPNYSFEASEEALSLCLPEWGESSFILADSVQSVVPRVDASQIRVGHFSDGVFNSMGELFTWGTLLTFAGVLAVGPLLLDAPRTDRGRARACNAFSGVMGFAFWSANLVGAGTLALGTVSHDTELIGEGTALIGLLWLTRLFGTPIFSRVLDGLGGLASQSSHGSLQSWARALQHAARNPQALTAMAMCAHSLDEVAGLKKIIQSLWTYLSRLALEQQTQPKKLVELTFSERAMKNIKAYQHMQLRRMGGLPAAFSVVGGVGILSLPARGSAPQVLLELTY